MAPQYKLTYFNLKGLGEPIRFLLKYGEIDYEDVRVEIGDWPKLKGTTPFGQLPTLEYNERIAFQSTSIARYVGKLVKLAGANDWENLEIDSVVDTIVDMRAKITGSADNQEELKKVLSETVPYYLDRLEEMVKKNKGFFVLGKMTWADVYFAGTLDYINYKAGVNIIEKYPNLKKLVENVLVLPQIKQWVANRPKTDF